ncbi:MAG: hypothetical protein CK425_05705 [Parachlamydia sp.]|nr:MAG: hypothetical protein CK425_05705 [Parachlamydia sp.]
MQKSVETAYNDIFEAEYYLYFADKMFSEERIEKELQFIISVLNLTPEQTILDLPCGHGKYTNALARKGFAVTGIDVNPAFIERAKADAEVGGLFPQYILGDMRDISFNEQFNCVLTLNTSWGYFDHDENVRVLANISRSLKLGGFLVIELLNPYLSTLFPKGIKNCSAFDYDQNLLIDWMSYVPEKNYFHQKRVYIRNGLRKDSSIDLEKVELDEMKKLIKNVGLDFVDVYGGLKGRPFNQDANSMVIICQKNGTTFHL